MNDRTPTEAELLPCPFCEGKCDPRGWLDGSGKRGPECMDCGATAPFVEDWNRRASPPAPAAEPVANIFPEDLRALRSLPEHRATLFAMPEDGAVPLYTHPLDAAAIRAEALEEHIRLLNTEAKRLLDEAEAMPTGFEQDSRGVAMILEARALDEAADALRRLADKGEVE